MIKAIIFDWGGTCSRYGIAGHFSEVVSKRTGISKKRILEAFQKYNDYYILGKMSGRRFFSSLAKELGIKDFGLMRVFIESGAANSYMLSLVKSVRKNYKTALLSDNYKDLTDHIVAKHRKLFDVMVFSNRVKVRKPHKEIYLLTLKRLRAKPVECVFIDDKLKNVKGAQKLGINAILFENEAKLKSALSKLGVRGLL